MLDVFLYLIIIALGIASYLVGHRDGHRKGYDHGFVAGHRHGQKKWIEAMAHRRSAEGGLREEDRPALLRVVASRQENH